MKSTCLFLSVIGTILLSTFCDAWNCHGYYCPTLNDVSPDYIVPFLVMVKQKNLDLLEKTALDVSNPNSPNYGKYLSHAEIVSMTSNRTAADAAVSFFNAEGVHDLKLIADGAFIEGKAKVREVERLFSASYKQYYHTETKERLHRSLEFRMPEALAPHVNYIAHVTEFPFLSRPIITANKVNLSSPNADTPATPQNIRQTYGITTTGSRGSMSVFETGQDYMPSDLTKFEQHFNLPLDNVAKVVGPNDPTACVSNSKNCGEASLDVQYIMAIGHNVPLTYWSIKGSDTTPFFDWIKAIAATTNPPLVNSMSYGSIEQENSASLLSATETEFQKMASRGLSILISSGDDGVANYGARSNPAYCGFNPSWPSSSPWVTALGATAYNNGVMGDGEVPCQTNGATTRPCIITTGGGFSSFFAQPAYQSTVVQNYINRATMPPTTSNPGQYPATGYNPSGRAYPDLAVLGHNYPVFVNGQLGYYDGTSCSAPVMAGMVALMNSKRLQNGRQPMGFLNQWLYNLHSTTPSAFNDVTVGNNRCTADANICCSRGYHAVVGWDAVSGLGTPNFGVMLSKV
jgi:tripeptidyl-peptidase-1